MAAPIVFDRKLYAARRARAERGGAESFLVDRAVETLAERLSAMNMRFGRALDLTSRNSAFARLAPYAEQWLQTRLWCGDGHGGLIVDEEILPFRDGSFDLITSVLALHAVNDLPGALVQIRRALAPEGLFLAALFGGETLRELRLAFAGAEVERSRGASPRVAPFADVRDMGALLQRAGFAKSVADLDRINVRYRSFGTLAADLRAIGETNALAGRSRKPLSRGVLEAVLAGKRESDQRGSLATFDLLYLTGWASRGKL